MERIVYSGPIRNELQNGGGVAQIGANAVEPTDAFPLGVPAATTLTARVRAIPTVVAYGRGSDGRTRPLRGLSVGTLAHIEALLRDDPQQMALYGVAQLAGYALGEEKMVALRVVVAPQVWKESAITIADYDLSATPVPWKQLPEPYPQQIAAAIDRAKGQREPPPTRSVPPPR